jgi:mono/diheme cytochrome c family protein
MGALWALISSLQVHANSSGSAQTHATDEALVAKGRAVYMSNCTACHNRDPNKKGSLGPELVGTPLEVFKIKVVTGNQYPEGYTPKRKTKAMKKLPQLEKDIPAIHAWIQSVATPVK